MNKFYRDGGLMKTAVLLCLAITAAVAAAAEVIPVLNAVRDDRWQAPNRDDLCRRADEKHEVAQRERLGEASGK